MILARKASWDGRKAWSFKCGSPYMASKPCCLHADKVADLGPKIAKALGTKGGGRPGAFQGKLASLDKLPKALKVLHETVQPSRTSIGGAVSCLSPTLIHLPNGSATSQGSFAVNPAGTVLLQAPVKRLAIALVFPPEVVNRYFNSGNPGALSQLPTASKMLILSVCSVAVKRMLCGHAAHDWVSAPNRLPTDANAGSHLVACPTAAHPPQHAQLCPATGQCGAGRGASQTVQYHV